MAKAERQPITQTSAVASCAATDCKHNEDRNCMAGEVRVTMQDGRAICGTYAPAKPKPRP